MAQSEVFIMKTTKAIIVTSILNGIFCFFCIVSTSCFAINRYFDLRVFFDIANILIYGWIINPVGIISFVICLVLFLVEHKDFEAKQGIGKKWVWIFIWPVVTTVFYLTAVILTVAFTGGV